MISSKKYSNFKIEVIKKDGARENFNVNKLVKSLLNSEVDYEHIDSIISVVCGKIYDKISTDEIKRIVCEVLKEIDNQKGTKYAKNYQFKNVLKVRTSKNEFQPFDKNSIIATLVDETGLDKKTAEKISNEIEKEIKKLNLKYLTAPMIRELVNAKLIEHGLEEFRQKHTRLGIPIYDIKKLINQGSRENANLMHNPESIHKWVADETMKQYALLEVFPKHIADAHMKGDIHLHDLEYAAIRPVCCQHDLRNFFMHGLKVDGTGRHTSVSKPAKHAEVAIQHAAKVLSAAQCEMSGGQSIDEFNIWLAPYMKGLPYDRIKQLMQMFIYEMNQMYVARGGQSLVKDELIFVKDNRGLKVCKIGELVDEFMEKYKDDIIIKGDTELIYLDEKEELYTISVNVNTGKAEFKRIYALSRHKPHNKIYKVVGKDGTTVSITEDHSLFNYNENGQLMQVKPKDMKHIIRNFDNPYSIEYKIGDSINTNYKRTDSKYNSRQNDIPNTIKITKELCQFLGLFVADGSYGTNSIRIATVDEDIREFITEFVKELNSDISISIKDNEVSFTNKGMYEFFNNVLGINRGAENKNIPEIILKGDNEIKLAFLGGLISGDGYVGKNGRVQIYTTSKQLLGQLHLLLSDLNMIYSINKVKDEGEQIKIKGNETKRNHKLYVLEIAKNKTDLLNKYIIPKYKTDRIKGSDYEQLSYDYSIIKEYLRNITNKKPYNDCSWKSSDRKLKLNTLEKIEELNPELKDELTKFKLNIPFEIMDINEIDYESYVYDLSVKDNENFITATGILCHNTVFSSINLEIEVPKYLKDKPAVIAGTTKGTYGDYEEEAKMILEALIDVMMEGDAVGKPFLFPNFIVKLREKAFSDENKELMIKLHKLSSKWGLPYFINMLPDWQANNTNAMGCRTRLSGDWTGDTENDTLRTGNMQWYTLNLPRIAYEANRDDDRLFEIIDEKLAILVEALNIKHKTTLKILDDRIMPFMTQKFGDEQYYRYDNTTKTFGFVGLNELLQYHIGEELHTSKDALKFGEKVIQHIRNYANNLKKETGLRWTLTQTPAESSLPYDEKILIVRDGKYELVKIGEFVESSFKKYESGILEYGENNSEVFIKYDNIYAPSFDKNDNIVLKPITHAIRHKGKEIYEIETTKNKKVKITGDHSVFALDNDLSVVEVKASNLKEGDFIITPKKIPSIERKNIYLSDIIKNKENYYGKINNHKKYLKENETSIKEEYASYKTPYKDLKSIMRRKNIFRLKALKSVKSEDIKGISYRSSKYIPNKINLNYDFGYLIGAFLSEGHWNEKNVEISNTDKGFIEELCNIINEVFGKDSYYVSLKDDKRRYKPLYVIGLCKTVSMVFKEFGLNELSKGKKIPSIMLSNEEFLMGLIKGHIVGDGNIYINNDKSDYSIRLYTTSEGLKETLGMALKILGIDFKVSVDRKSEVNEKWNDCYVIKITGAENLNKLLCTNIKNNGGKDIIPKLPVQFKKIIDTHTQKEWMEKYDINIRSLHIWEDIKKGYISRNRAEKLFNIFNSIDEIKNNHKLLMNTIKNVIYGDLQFEKIKSIKKLDAPNYVYDISVEDTENFIGGENGFVCLHNTAGRFARLDHQHYKKETESVVKGDLSNIGSAYYTNSSHPRVDEGITLGEKVAIDEVFHPLCNGGHMGHFWNAEAYADPEGLMEITRKISTRDVGFWTYTKNLSICEKCSVAMGGLKDNCNNCGSSEIQKYSRITGYLQNISNWNDAKRRELADRKSNIKKI